MTVGLFVSYTRPDERPVRTIRDDLERLGRSVWMDHQIHGGESWWREIIREIQRAEIFVFALSNHSWRSKPCRLELRYAEKLGIPVLPMQVGPLDSMFISLAEKQIIDYRDRSADAVVRLVNALTELTARPVVLPDPLPAPPDVPFEYLYRIASLLGPDRITPEAQDHLISQLRSKLKEEDDEVARADIVKLLKQVAGRGELTVQNAREIDEILAGVIARSVPAQDGGATRLPPTEPGPTESDVDSERPAEPELTGEAVGLDTPEPAGSTVADPTATDRPADAAPDEPVDPRAADEPADKPADKPTDKPADEPAARPAEQPVGTATVPGWLRDIVQNGGGTATGTKPEPKVDPTPSSGWWARQDRPAPDPADQRTTTMPPARGDAGQYRISNPRTAQGEPPTERTGPGSRPRPAQPDQAAGPGRPAGPRTPPGGAPTPPGGQQAGRPGDRPAAAGQRQTAPPGAQRTDTTGRPAPPHGQPARPAGPRTETGRTRVADAADTTGLPTPTPKRRFAPAGGLLGVVGIVFLVVGLGSDHEADSPAVATVLLFATVLGLSLAVVSATRHERGARMAIAVAAAGLLGAVGYALSSFGAF
jgi:hypothetical protein